MTETTATATDPLGACRRSDCDVANDGSTCALEHLDLLECPEFEPAEDAGAGAAVAASGTAAPRQLDVRGRQPIDASDASDDVYLGEALTMAEASAILQDRPARVVVPLGSVRVGKTTLLASLWEVICSGDVDGWSYVDSLSPYGFEERCHLASFYSEGERPDTSRTPEGAERVLLHVAVQRVTDEVRERRDLLLVDVSGEHATNFVRADEPGPLPPLLRAADVVAVLVDGERLAGSTTRWAAINDARALARVIRERGELQEAARVVAVVTKWDTCAAMEGIDETVSRLESELTTVSPGLEILRCAARSESDSVAEGTGVAEFLAAALKETKEPVIAPPQAVPGDRQLSRFKPGGAILRRLMTAGGGS